MVFAALALERFPVRNGQRWFPNAEKGFVDPGERTSRKSVGECGLEEKITRKEYKRLLNNFEMEVFLAQKGLWNLAKEKIMKERGELPNEEGDAVRDIKPCMNRNEEEKGEKRRNTRLRCDTHHSASALIWRFCYKGMT